MLKEETAWLVAVRVAVARTMHCIAYICQPVHLGGLVQLCVLDAPDAPANAAFVSKINVNTLSDWPCPSCREHVEVQHVQGLHAGALSAQYIA